MKLQPKDLYPFIPVRKESDQAVCNKTVSVLFAILNVLKSGQSLESDNIEIHSLGDNLLYILPKVSPEDIEDNIKLDFSSTNGIY